MIAVVYSVDIYYVYRPDLVAYETISWQYSKDNSFSITCRKGHKSVLTTYRILLRATISALTNYSSTTNMELDHSHFM